MVNRDPDDPPEKPAVKRLFSNRALAQAILAFSALLLPGVAALPGRAADRPPTAQELRFFEARVRPVLAERCYACHGATRQSGGLRLDSRAAMLQGGTSGPALLPGDAVTSLLLRAVRHQGPEMPPGGTLKPEEIAALASWVKQGAPYPEPKTASSAAERPGIGPDFRNPRSAAAKSWWAFQPVRRPALPEVSDPRWSRNPIDRFVWQRLRKEGLSPAPEADRRTLIRRVTLDLHGLPPTPEEVDAFVNDPSPDAYEKLVDRLLASPRYGERWARHWLDLVRYADSDGYRIDDYRPNAWRYRDYVIRALNDDKPYDRFVQEQLAGDELFPSDPDALVATGYLRHWIYEYNNRDVRGQWTTILNDITDTTGDVFLGVGIQCARCHDHKFDPILQKDYYRLQSFFAPMLPREDLVAATPAQRAEYQRKLAAWETKTRDLRGRIAALEAPVRAKAAGDAIAKFPPEIQAMIRKPVAQRTPQEHQLAELAYRQVDYEYARLETHFKGEAKEQWLALRKQLAQFDREKPEPLPVAMAVTDVGAAAPPVLIPKKGKDPVEPGFLTVLDEKPATIAPAVGGIPASTGRRAALAHWLTRSDNPLTARVIVNRVWQYHFGRGLAANASDFGSLGDRPTHPELLDWLASEFVASAPSASEHGSGGVAEYGGKAPGSGFPHGLGPVALAGTAVQGSDRRSPHPLTPSPSFRRGGTVPPHGASTRETESRTPPNVGGLEGRVSLAPGLGWSLKALHRLIVTSATYRQSSHWQPAADALASNPQSSNPHSDIRTPQSGNPKSAFRNPQSKDPQLLDPENRLYWRGGVRRLEAEQIRDSLLAVTGELDARAGGPGVPASEPRRTIYTRVMRNNRDPLLDVFDLPLFFNSASSRDTTTTPVQSLLLINSQSMLLRSRALAARLERDSKGDPARAVEEAYRLAFGRAPTSAESAVALQFLEEQTRRIDPAAAGSAEAAFLHDKLPFRDGQAAVLSPNGPQKRFEVAHDPRMPTADFTIEAFVLVRSIYDSGAVRTIAAKWDGSNQHPGWGFGITGKQSRRKPQTLVLQLIGKKRDGALGEAAIFSDQHIQLNKPYYVAASVHLAEGGAPGSVTFFVKDLSNDDEPLQTAVVPHPVIGGFGNELPLTIGGRPGSGDAFFDGLLDDVRLSRTALGADRILFTTEGTSPLTIGYWQFEAKPDVFHDSSGNGLAIRPSSRAAVRLDPKQAALADFCHVLLNSSEFLYVD